ncbi:hypothetical protein [Catenovulum maritimum]|uniref:hypothetical protein n=1 Tax=Catenovulum maritimum TaxID=1513271 RepID=UPI000AA393C8|nr:hypothetical protein [Catenovulum maritimum]
MKLSLLSSQTWLAACLIPLTLASCSAPSTHQAPIAYKKIFKPQKESAKFKSQPNILWIITDDQRPDSVSYYNQLVYGQKIAH